MHAELRADGTAGAERGTRRPERDGALSDENGLGAGELLLLRLVSAVCCCCLCVVFGIGVLIMLFVIT